MNVISRRLSESILFVSVILFYMNPSVAALDDFSPYAKARILYDSNLFRYSDDVMDELLQGNDKDDTITYIGVGFTSDIKISRQHLLFDLDLDRAIYRTYDNLDHTKVNGKAVWSWLAGNLWSGNLGYKYRDELSSFNEFNLPVKDMRTRGTTFFDVGYQLHPDWRIEGEVSYMDVTYELRSYLDRETRAAQLEAQYKNTLNTQIGMRYRYAGHVLTSQDNDFKENEISGVFYWQGSGKSALEAQVGYLDIIYEYTEERNFNGVSANVIYHWIITGKTRLDIAAWREPSSKNDEIASYVLSQGLSIRPIWSATRVISVEGELRYENDDFKGSASIDGEQRIDDILLVQLKANWNPRRYLRFSLGYRKENRDSNYEFRDFRDDQLNFTARVNF